MAVPDRRRLSDEDIERLAEAVVARQIHHACKLTVTPEEVSDAVKFMKHVNSLMSETGSTIRKTILVAGIGGVISLLILGVYAKLRNELGL